MSIVWSLLVQVISGTFPKLVELVQKGLRIGFMILSEESKPYKVPLMIDMTKSQGQPLASGYARLYAASCLLGRYWIISLVC